MAEDTKATKRFRREKLGFCMTIKLLVVGREISESSGITRLVPCSVITLTYCSGITRMFLMYLITTRIGPTLDVTEVC